MTAVLAPAAVAGITTSTGTGTFTITGPLPVPGGGGANYRLWSTIANGTYVHCWRADVGAANFERGVASVANSGGSVTLSWVARLETSAGGSSPVNWTGGQQDVWTVGGVPSLTDWAAYAADIRSAIGLGTAAVRDVGTGPSNLIQVSDLSGLLPSPSAPSVPSGSKLGGWYQSAAPAGWTRDASMDDGVMRIVKAGTIAPGSGGAGTFTGGSWAPSGLSADSHTLTTSEVPSHTHTFANSVSQVIVVAAGGNTLAATGSGVAWIPDANNSGILTSSGGGGGHTHTVSGGSSWRPPCYDVLVATKN